MNNKKRTFLKSAVIGVTAIATSLTIGFSAACSTGSGSSSSDTDDDKTTTKIDEQTIKNGNFEFYSDNKGIYPISNPDSWSRGSNGNSSSSISGVIDTGKEHWDYITDPDLPQTLEDNDDLESGDENKKDYNGALADDLPYKNPHEATDSSSEDENAKDYIENPFTHKYRYDADGKILDENGDEVTTYEDDDGNLYLDEEHKTPLETSVLMIHNYRRNDYHGAETYFSSSTTVTLEANTAAEISMWVKTTELYFSGADTTRKPVTFDRGAYIKVNTQVGGNSLDAFEIKNINTEQLIETPYLSTENEDDEKVIDYANWENNGWVKYTVYVAASSFSATSVSITLGLGEDEANTVEGYAFFDDVSIKKYKSVDDMKDSDAYKGATFKEEDDENNGVFANVSYPLSPDAKSEFRVDKESYKTNDTTGGGIITDKVYENNFADRVFFIDFASYNTEKNKPVPIGSENVTAGLTVDDTNTGKYVCTEYNSASNAYKTNLDVPEYAGLYIPSALRTKPLQIGDDIIATTTVGSAADWEFSAIETKYALTLTNALKSAPDLPGAGENPAALVMLSASGAAYEAHITDDSFVLNDDGYMLISFWIKTSAMDGKTAATVTVKGTEGDDKDITSSFTVDSTTLSKVTIGEGEDKIEDAYNGWARCFVRVSNTSKDKENAKPFEIVVNFGNTSIRDTNKSAYNYGWVALTNISVMELDEDVYGYTSNSSQSATIEFTEETEKTTHLFDTEQGEKNEIKDDLATPSSYTGVNGASKSINPDSVIELDGYHDSNKNDYAGLLSKDNFENYSDCMWYNVLQTIEQDNLAEHDNNLWNAVFGERTVQPLLIVNTLRKKADNSAFGDKRYNYGYIGNSASVSSDGYTAVSVRVKASDGAVANVYLVENKTGGEVLSYKTPKYNFWYDADGNILKHEPAENETLAEQKENIAYTLRKDGLYENGDGKLYANFYNLTRHYDRSFEHEKFFDESGTQLVYSEKNIKDDTIYYGDAAKTKYAPHYLIAGGKENNKVYLYNSGIGDEATYYYVEDGVANKNKLVSGIEYGGETGVELRYDNTENDGVISTPYQFTIDTVEHPEYADKWITVTFYIHAGAESKDYKLELWSGSRDKESDYETGDYAKDSYVIFDYSDLSSSLSQTTFDGLVNGYVSDIKAKYNEKIFELGKELPDNDANINELKEIAEGEVDIYGYEADYYTFSLFDSAAFIPFNGEINTDDTGYSFDYTESVESLAFLKVVDNCLPYGSEDEPEAYTMSAFIDYSVIDKDVDIIGEPTAPGAGDSDSETTASGDSVNVWLLASSIVLVVAIFVAIAAIFIRDFVKKHKGKKTSGKNSYNFNKNKRYVKKYVKANGEAPVVEDGEIDESLLSDKPEEKPTANDGAADAVETVEAVEETPAKTGEEPSDEPAETSAEPEEQKHDGDDKTDDGKEE
ncbi:MAG: hypothetical protein NC033_03555 [Clostridiales bacterium]|nr:hypothetical protein [Clostridiales bacterium]